MGCQLIKDYGASKCNTGLRSAFRGSRGHRSTSKLMGAGGHLEAEGHGDVQQQGWAAGLWVPTPVHSCTCGRRV